MLSNRDSSSTGTVLVAFTHTKKVHIVSVNYKGEQCFESENIVTDPNPDPTLQKVTDPDPNFKKFRSGVGS
jgi:hypothetical protein